MKLKLILSLLVIVTVVAISSINAIPANKSKASTTSLSVPTESVRYVSYSPEKFAQMSHQRRVLFFRAQWCTTCSEADKELSSLTYKLPADVTVFEVNYDAEKSLKKQYNVTYQHTFVLVDEQGHLKKLWNGGGITQLLENLS